MIKIIGFLLIIITLVGCSTNMAQTRSQPESRIEQEIGPGSEPGPPRATESNPIVFTRDIILSEVKQEHNIGINVYDISDFQNRVNVKCYSEYQALQDNVEIILINNPKIHDAENLGSYSGYEYTFIVADVPSGNYLCTMYIDKTNITQDFTIKIIG